ncbi:hypothetical protein SAMD00019534_000010 [Acytostelium subglobosum LB1]|uniref:hypothetical protein n=1 Tax=Acytostelium subglobosum LB1 TaxID=1410327 RepID=UPI000644ECFA|nr:hypothetical protein SAMD00019534_000010 [Acytostelium subglobosum LB1]GAM16826.1 hypothetical protein SAMD00019534_000010 [Acytostelium subglobosum LB1]|eukprot:XP_012758888.1 hypothetical protein SAMD00019534_000010 [Acytostelium subglobosum LB1]
MIIGFDKSRIKLLIDNVNKSKHIDIDLVHCLERLKDHIAACPTEQDRQHEDDEPDQTFSDNGGGGCPSPISSHSTDTTFISANVHKPKVDNIKNLVQKDQHQQRQQPQHQQQIDVIMNDSLDDPSISDHHD